MKLSLSALKENNAFSAKPVEVTIEWKGKSFTTFVRHLSYQTAVGDVKARSGGGDVYAHRIASSLCDEDGVALFTVSDITGENDPERGGMDPDLVYQFLIAIGKVQDLGKSAS